MKTSFTLVALFTALVFGTAYAADAEDSVPPPKQPTAQQSKMKTCNAEAKSRELKGDDRKAFMKDCLRSKPAAQ